MTKLLVIGAVALAALFILARMARKRCGTYENRKKTFEERLRKTAAETRDQALSTGVTAQMRPIAAAIRELLEFADNPPGFALLEDGRTVRLQSPAGEIRIDFGIPRTRIARTSKPGRPLGCWQISGPGLDQKEYLELADVVMHLKRVISGEENPLRGKTPPG